jgi:phospholipid/cholesterol/gamma-HCH transport system substrate-binding protein
MIMENRSHALMAGAFTLLLLAAAIIVAIWLTHDRVKLIQYDLISEVSVNGLATQSSVRYQGVPVGKVLELRLNPHRPGEVRIRIGVNPATPITKSTWGELGLRGVTGGTNVELHDDGKSSVALVSTDDTPAVIPLKAGLLDRLEGRVTTILSNVELATTQMNKMLTDSNVTSWQTLLNNAADLTSSMKVAAKKLAPVADKIAPLIASLQEATRQATGMARDVGSLSRSARVAINRLNAANGPLASVTRSMDEISYAASRLNNDTLPAISSMANTVSQTARGASTAVQRFGDAPQSILFGPARMQAGPGEPGFTGFGGYASGVNK